MVAKIGLLIVALLVLLGVFSPASSVQAAFRPPDLLRRCYLPQPAVLPDPGFDPFVPQPLTVSGVHAYVPQPFILPDPWSDPYWYPRGPA